MTWPEVEVKEFDIRPRPRLDDILDLLANRLAGAHYGESRLVIGRTSNTICQKLSYHTPIID